MPLWQIPQQSFQGSLRILRIAVDLHNNILKWKFKTGALLFEEAARYTLVERNCFITPTGYKSLPTAKGA